MSSTSDALGPRLYIYVILALIQVLTLNCRSQAPLAESSPTASPTLKQSSESLHISQIWEEERAQLNKNSKDYPAKCPRFVATDAIELYLANSGVPDPLLILFDSYEESKNAPAHNEIIEILSNIFQKHSA